MAGKGESTSLRLVGTPQSVADEMEAAIDHVGGDGFLLFHGGDQVAQKRSLHATSYTFPSRRHLHHGFTYTLFLYAYPPSQPEGTSIGRTTFRVR